MEKIHKGMTLEECFESGFVTESMIETFNKRILRQQRKSLTAERVNIISQFIKDFVKPETLYRTNDFMTKCMEEYSEFVDDVPGFQDKRVEIHKLITRSLKHLVNEGIMEVVNKTGNHAHNRYGLKVDREELPVFTPVDKINEGNSKEQ